MADINLDANGCSNSKHFSHAPASISWHSEKDCTVYFTPSSGNCFGNVASITFPPKDQSLTVVSNPPTTQFSTPCPDLTVYDITFGDGVPKPPAAKKAPAKKAAPKKAAPKKAPAKKKAGTARKVSAAKKARKTTARKAKKTARGKKKKR